MYVTIKFEFEFYFYSCGSIAYKWTSQSTKEKLEVNILLRGGKQIPSSRFVKMNMSIFDRN